MVVRTIKTLVNENQSSGHNSIIWNATNDYNRLVSAGLYIYKIEAGKFRKIKKMLLLK